MILVQNHQQLLNGSKALLAAIFLIVTLSSCELFKPLVEDDNNKNNKNENLDPIQGRRVYDPATGTYVIVRNAPTGSMDTIIWRTIPTTIEPPIYSTASPISDIPNSNPVKPIGLGPGNSQLLSSYNVSVVLPFLSGRYNSLDKDFSANSAWALQFYNGMEMAFDELSGQGVKLNVSVMDSKANERQVGNLARTNRDLNDAHLIIGPYLRNNTAILADKARTTGAVIVSPHSASSTVSAQNPNYVQLKPTLESHCQAIMQHVYDKYTRNQIVLVCMDKASEEKRFDYFQKEYQLLSGMADTIRLRELTIDTTKLDMVNFDFKPWFGFDRETVFIVPSWSNEIFIYNLLRKLDVDKNDYQQVVVYGMPQWMDYERIDFDYYEKLNVHVSSSIFIDDFNPDIRAFKRRYFDQFGQIPNEEAYVGYDLTNYFGRMINKHGTLFQLQLEANPEQLLHTKFDFRRIITPTATALELPRIERFENKFVNILKFKNYRFNKAD